MEGNSSQIGAIGSVENAPVLVRGLSGAVLEDEEGNEDDVVSDASEEGSEGSENDDNDDSDDSYPLPASWRDAIVEEFPGGAPLNFGLPDFTPAGRGVGRVHELDNVAPDSVWQHFRLFYPDNVFNTFIVATNSNGVLRYRRTWKALTLGEFKAFLGCVLHLGVVQYPSRKHAWNSGPTGSSFLRSIMSRDRFDQILRCWRFLDYNAYTNEQINQMKLADPFWAVQDYCEVLRAQFSALWNPAQFMDIDEQTIPWKGRHKCRNYNPNKPEKWHFKVWCLNDSSTGYLQNFFLYRGKAEQRPPGVPASAYPAYALLEDEKYHNRGHINVSDNFFTSFDETGINAERGIHTLGTLRANRQGLPTPRRGKMVRGEFHTKVTDWRGIQVWYTEWQDRKVVKMLHTFPTYRDECLRSVKGAQGWERKAFNRPNIIKRYNQGMGGTDAVDQRVACYRPRVKTITWMQRIFVHFLNVAVVNCFIYCKHSQRTDLPNTHLEFREQLIEDLCDDIVQSRILHQGEVVTKRQRLDQWEKDRSRLTGLHLPEQEYTEEGKSMDPDKNLRENGNTTNSTCQRGRCLLCSRRVTCKCSTCGVFLCILNDEYGNNCYKEWHTKAKFRQNCRPAAVVQNNNGGEEVN